jgi:hypothetical protein
VRRFNRRFTVATKKKSPRGGSKRGKLKIGKSRKGWTHTQTRNSVKKKLSAK